MRTLIVGFLAFALWSTLSTYLYVCKIKGLCYESFSLQANAVAPQDKMGIDSLPKPAVKEKPVVPKDLVIYFAFDKSEFNVNDQTGKYFDESNEYLEQNAETRLTITGHTDAIGTNDYNQALGYRRAQSVKNYFEGEGMPASKITIESKGEMQPVDNNSTQEGRANNRRTVITIKK